MKDTRHMSLSDKWEKWAAENPNIIAISICLAFGEKTPYDVMRKIAKERYPDWKIIHINDSKFLCTIGYAEDGVCVVYESSLNLINRQGEQKTITFHTIGIEMVNY